MVEGILHMWRLWGGVVMAILRLAMETQALPTDETLDEPLGRHQRDFLWCHIFLYQWWTGMVCHHNIILASRNVYRWREEQTVTDKSSSVIFFTVHIIWTSFCGVCTWAVLVCLELSDRGTSTHGDQLCPKLHWLLKHQKDPQSLEWAAAGMPDRREEIYRPTLKQQVQLPLTKHLYVTLNNLSIQRGRILLSMTVCTLLYVVHIQNYEDSWVSEIWI